MKWLSLGLLPLVLGAQQPLTLAEAVRIAQTSHPSIQAASARLDAALHRIQQARSGIWPKLNYQESYQRSNNPVFVFSTLLTQRRFGEENFRINALNNPSSVQNFQSVLSVDQTLWDFGLTKRQTELAELQRQLTDEERRLVEMNLGAGAVRFYLGVLLAEQALQVAREAVASATADLKRAENVRAAGMSTDADVLSLKVHLAAMKENEIARRSELEVAKAALNEALGAPLDTERQLVTPLTALANLPAALEDLEKRALSERPDARQALLGIEVAQKQAQLARLAWLPQVSARGVLEANRGRFITQAGGNWFAGLNLRWNLFNGYADRAKLREAQSMMKSYEAQHKQVSSALRLQVRKAYAEWTAANERMATASAAVAQAEESLRITRNRYEAGLATLTDLLRTETAKNEAVLRKLIAVHDQRLAAAMVALAAGALTPDSEVLR
ncbi:MAG: TolC family protein [Bryobacteraceae bacterium]|nr:TolC family protein [Bryobacteraceae bacterium]MDW8377450.1 TolC family protein [Bryobacterales bacterium]